METTNLDDLELELRKLPGVRAAGFSERDDMLIVQVQVAGDEPTATLSQQAARIAYRHADKPVALEIVRWKIVHAPAAPTPVTAGAAPAEVVPVAATPSASEGDATGGADAEETQQRVRLLAVLTFPDTDELEVHLTFGGRRIIYADRRAEGLPRLRRPLSKVSSPLPPTWTRSSVGRTRSPTLRGTGLSWLRVRCNSKLDRVSASPPG